MTSSLVGSEMCIRDSPSPAQDSGRAAEAAAVYDAAQIPSPWPSPGLGGGLPTPPPGPLPGASQPSGGGQLRFVSYNVT
eukprot:6466071-Prorocentrum_lima.AAC.1